MTNFITNIVGDGPVVTRFPPEPNGYLHLGHAKSICLNFGLAHDHCGRCHLRMDDTNPLKEDAHFVRSIQEDVLWLGFDWGEHLYHASDYFDRILDYAEQLITKGLAYVCLETEEEVRAGRGTLTSPGTPSPWRDTTPEHNLNIFQQMRMGTVPAGECTLRAKIDMGHPNMKMRDPVLARVLHAKHHRTGSRHCVYPLYDLAHCISDSLEGITHSLCTLEFENNRFLYDWILENLDGVHRPRQIEFARLQMTHTVLSKRKLQELVTSGQVSGWDDPRMPTIAGLRRRGIRPEAIRDFIGRIGVAKNNSTVSADMLDVCIREDMNADAPRLMAVVRPLKVTLTNWPENQVVALQAPLWPRNVPNDESRTLSFSKHLYIEQGDFMENPVEGWKRLSPQGLVRLRHAQVIRCDSVVRDADGHVVELLCSVLVDPGKIKGLGTIHWVDAGTAISAEVRLYDRLFAEEHPDETSIVNPDSLEVVYGARVEAAWSSLPSRTRVQFERVGYFWEDPVDSTPEHLVLCRIIALQDSWKKVVSG